MHQFLMHKKLNDEHFLISYCNLLFIQNIQTWA